MNQKEDMSEVQDALTLENILNNTIRMFDTLLLNQKDAFIQKYEEGQEDFVEA